MKEILKQVYWGNTVLNYIECIGVILLVLIAIRIFRTIALQYLKKWAAKTETTLDDFLVVLIEKNILPILNIGAFYAGLNYLEISPRVSKIISAAYAIAITYFLVRIIIRFLRHGIERYVNTLEEGEAKKKQIGSLMIIVKVLIWVVAIIFMLDNIGYDITAIVAGLGIGGIAIALAAQTVLGDLFSYFVIFFDKPFQIGDFITVDDKKGTVEYVGIKTTRIRSLTGEQLIVSNTNLTNSRVHNFKQMLRRRIAFSIGVTYQTPADKLAKIPEIIGDIITRHELATFDRAHFATFGDFSLNFEIVYFVETSEFLPYMNIQQSINMALYKTFEDEGIEFAYPTQTLYVEKTAIIQPTEMEEKSVGQGLSTT